ncbi:Pyridine nucleotide-disulphide oxidoreductase [uncultured virus]|nr:Pyridine nucleotide-disulphide oxidoreductase [uncultured virus]
MYDTLIIGSGPAGYTAGIYSVRAGLKTIILEGINFGGQLMTTTEVYNFPGFPDGIGGYDLMINMRSQCSKLGCELKEDQVISVAPVERHFEISTENSEYLSRTVIVATGATAKRLNLPNEEKFWNHGVSACAVCDGALPMFRNKPLVVIGGGDTACEEALFLSRFGSIVYMLVRGDKMRASHHMKSKVQSNNKIQVRYQTEVTNVHGVIDDKTYLTGVTIINNQTQEMSSLDISGLFYAIGHTPNTSFLNNMIETDDAGYAVAQNTITNVPGIFVCGDVQDKVYRQAITAAGSGCMAALEAERYLVEHK